MFPSTFGNLLPETRRTHFHVASANPSQIDINFEDYGKQKKRSSFLPAKWQDEYSKEKVHSSVFYPSNFDPTERKLEVYCTGSKYLGEHNALGIARKGLYKYPHGVIYDGFFNKNGEFHGTGSLVYPNGQRVEGIWKFGKLIKGANYVTAEGSPYTSDYCKKRDRRFQIEVENGLPPAGQEYLTNAKNPPREIREGCYDAGEGFYMPSEKLIYGYDDPSITKNLADFAETQDPKQKELYMKILRDSQSEEFSLINQLHEQNVPRLHDIHSVPSEMKERWIIANCRKAWDEPVGFRPDLYEIWTTGKSDNVTVIRNKFNSLPNEDRAAEEMAKMVIEDASVWSLLFSFIISSQNRIEPSKSTFNKMLLPMIQNQQQSKTKADKISTTHAKKVKKSSKGSKKAKTSGEMINFIKKPKLAKSLDWKL